MLDDTAKIQKMTSPERAETVVYSLIEQNPGVEISQQGRPVTPEDVNRVLRGKATLPNISYNMPNG